MSLTSLGSVVATLLVLLENKSEWINHVFFTAGSFLFGIIQSQDQELLNLQKEQIESLKMWIVISLIFAFLIIAATSFIIQSNRLLKKQNATILAQQEEINKINRDLAVQNENLREMNAEKNMVISYVSHDLLTPLVNIEGLIQLIHLRKHSLEEDQKEYLQKMINVVDSGKELIHSLLNINKIEQEIRSIELMEYDAVLLVDDVITGHQIIANDKKVKIQQNNEADKVIFKTDKQYFKQIISNILSNAIKFSEPGETVFTSVSDHHKKVQIMIIDKGPGLSEIDKDRIFLKYKQVSNRPTANEKSAGLGLAIAKQLVERLNGKIRVESTLNVGTTFIVEFLK